MRSRFRGPSDRFDLIKARFTILYFLIWHVMRIKLRSTTIHWYSSTRESLNNEYCDAKTTTKRKQERKNFHPFPPQTYFCLFGIYCWSTWSHLSKFFIFIIARSWFRSWSIKDYHRWATPGKQEDISRNGKLLSNSTELVNLEIFI